MSGTNKTVIAVVALLVLGALEGYALSLGMDGWLLALVVSTLSSIAGWAFGVKSATAKMIKVINQAAAIHRQAEGGNP